MTNSAASPAPVRIRIPVFGLPVDAVPLRAAARQALSWAARGESRAVCAANAHMVVEARRDAALQTAVAAADLATADGWPVAYIMRRFGKVAQRRASGPDLTRLLFAGAVRLNIPVGFYGATEATLAALQAVALRRHPRLNIVFAHAPPFRLLTPDETTADAARINASGARLLFVGLGCPKQELWMAVNRGQIQTVMLGVGAAFDFLAGKKSRAPSWMRAIGLEWLHRLLSEPGRLWRRYLVDGAIFVRLYLSALLRGSASS